MSRFKAAVKILRHGSLSITLVANLVSLLGNMLLTLILPKQLGVSQYGYYQLYIFYTTFAGFLGFGWHEGIYLRYGGQYFDRINQPLLNRQWRLYSIIETAIGLTFSVAVLLIDSNSDQTHVYALLGLCIVVYLPRAFLHNIMQTTGRVREFAHSLIMEKLMHILLTAFGLLAGYRGFAWFVASDLAGRACAACYIFWVCRDLVLAKPVRVKDALEDIRLNIKSGIALMFANIAGILIVGIVRQAIERQWDVETFGRVSLALSVSNLLMVFIRAVAVVLFPMLKRADEDRITRAYGLIRSGLMVPVLGILVAYYPLMILLSRWLPQYAESLKYMALLFPICVFESKMSMLIETYMKALRMERKLLFVNVVSVALSAALSIVCVTILNDLTLAVLSILVLVAFRCVFSESLLTAKLGLRIQKDIVLEVLVAGSFVLFSWFVGGIAGAAMYFAVYAGYIFIKRDEVKAVVAHLKTSGKSGAGSAT